jgi:putative membrane protein
MPTQNFIGWTLTAIVFMTVARLLWRRDPNGESLISNIWFPVAVYAANIVFASALSVSVDLWIPVALAVMFGLFPAMMALRSRATTVS